jgi:hypothetical protein
MVDMQVSDESYDLLVAEAKEILAINPKLTLDEAIETVVKDKVRFLKTLQEVEEFLEKNKDLGYATAEEFILESARIKLAEDRKKLEGKRARTKKEP